MVGPLVRRKGKLVYHRGRGRYTVYSVALDHKRRAKTKMKHWKVEKRKRYRHTAD